MTGKRYDKISVSVEPGRDELRRLARRSGCSVSEYVRRAIALAIRRDQHGGELYVRVDGEFVQLATLPLEVQRSHEAAVPLVLSGDAEVSVAWSSPDGDELRVAINDTELLVGARDHMLATGWNLSAAMERSRTEPRVMMRPGDGEPGVRPDSETDRAPQ